MKIGIVSQWYPPEPAYIPADLATGLVARGHRVRVLTGYPTYPAGKLYPGYRQRRHDTATIEGVTVRRVPLYPSHDRSGTRRAANYLSFAASSAAAALSYLGAADVVYVYLTPATAFAAPALLRLVRGIPVVIHVQDIWPESVTSSGMLPGGAAGRLAGSVLHAAMRQTYRMASAIAVIAPSMRDLVVARGAAASRVRVVLNWADESLFRPVGVDPAARARLGHRDRCTIMYAGAMGPFQNIGDSIRAASAARDDVDLVLAGSGIGESDARTLTASLGADNVRFLGRLPVDEMAALYAAADYQLVTLKDLPIFRGTIPSKLPAALSCGSPVLVSVPGDSAALVEGSGAGLACPPENWQALAARFRQAAALSPSARAEMGRNALDTYRARMSRRAGLDQLEDMLVGVAR
ncbi:glycosyltransferase family 4 protein [Winogradskya humida]|uniref:Glycosyltransferase WbuB n=1 Tax=Winogradskya humida TaxID=113566 RepID=A0ABQ3ZXW9_9ACTN|nr:glycosyltransferase family 4 protein [Actinoplanes humidus]GIE23436.1 glycosyltransferase WbuB [Actinoplanes humidus]